MQPMFNITPAIARDLIRIEAAKHIIDSLPITPRLLANLRETARLYSTHYSTMIEGNLLTQEQVAKVIGEDQHFVGRDRDEQEVRGYYAALDEVERLAHANGNVTEQAIKKLHALVMGGGKVTGRPTPYRTEQNVIRDSRTNRIVYMPPEATAVPTLMAEMVTWINQKDELPVSFARRDYTLPVRNHPSVLRRERPHGAIADDAYPASRGVWTTRRLRLGRVLCA